MKGFDSERECREVLNEFPFDKYKPFYETRVFTLNLINDFMLFCNKNGCLLQHAVGFQGNNLTKPTSIYKGPKFSEGPVFLYENPFDLVDVKNIFFNVHYKLRLNLFEGSSRQIYDSSIYFRV
jgi:hypothetical protein